MRYIQELTKKQKDSLEEVIKNDTSHRARQRAHAIILSNKRYSINELSEIFEVDRDTISRWFNWWEEGGVKMLHDESKPGRNKILSPREEKQAMKIIEETPSQLNVALIKIEDKFKKTLSKKTLKRCLKKNKYIWKRTKRGVKKNEIIRDLKKQEKS